MYECVFPTVAHMSPKNIFTLGWDYSDPELEHGAQMEHYYPQDALKRTRNPSSGVVSSESKQLIESSKYFNDYLKEKKINLFVLSKKSYVSNEIERIVL